MSAEPEVPGFESRTVMQWTVVFAVVLALLWVGRTFLVPLAIALFVWALLNGLWSQARRIQVMGHRLPRGAAFLVALLPVVLGGWAIYAVLRTEVARFQEVMPDYAERLRGLAETWAGTLGIDVAPDLAGLWEQIDVTGIAQATAAWAGTLLIDILWVALYVVFLLAEQRYFAVKLRQLRIPGMSPDDLERIVERIARGIQDYIRIKTYMSALTGIVSFLILWSFGVDFARTWALVIFLLNYIPNIGSFVAVLFPVAQALVQFEILLVPLVLAALLGGTQALVGNVIEPHVAGRSLNLSPLALILGLTFWGILWGVAGMVLCVPIIASIAIICRHIPPLAWIAVLLSRDGRIEDGTR
jgi:AI-2 transport protein TqsA